MSIQNWDFTNLVSAKQLSDFLVQATLDRVRNKRKDDDDRLGLEREIRHCAMEDPDAPPFAKLITSLFGSDETIILDTMDYWNLRDRVQEYQKEMNISSVYFCKAKFKDEIFFYPVAADQLLPMPQDLGIISRHKDRVVNYYLDFVKRWHIPLQELFWDGRDETAEDTTVERLLEVAAKSKVASLSNVWGENTPVWTGGSDGEPSRICEYISDYQLRLSDGLEDMSKEDEEINSIAFSACTKLTV